MGYTHYWQQQDTINQATWADFTDKVQAILDAADVPLQHEFDEPGTKPEITGEHIWFNGVGDDGYETFYLTRVPRDLQEYEKNPVAYYDIDGKPVPREPGVFNFCKTARKPYDIVVVAILSIAPDGFKVSSDGDDEELKDGRALAATATA